MGKKRTGLNALHRDHPDKDTGAVGQHVEFERLIDILDKGRLTKVELEHLSLCVPCSVLLRKLHEFASDSGEKGLSGPERLAPHPDHLGEEIGTAGQHVEVERLTAYYEGRMTAAEREELQEHLSLCVRCSVLLRELQEFAADSGERGLSGPESLEQDAWELLAQSRPVGTTERPMPLFPFVQHFFSEASADLLDAVFHPFARKYEMTNPGGEPPYWGRIAAGRSVSVVGDSRHAWIAILPPAATLRDEETCPATIFLREGTVNSVRIPVQEGGFTVTLSLAEYPPYREYRFELLDRNGKVLCSRHQRGESLSGDTETSVYVGAHSPGFYRLRIEGHDANRRELLVEYLLEVEPAANDGTAGPKGP